MATAVSFKIEKGVPPPLGGRKYPFDQMDVGDSFFVPAEVGSKAEALIRSAAHAYTLARSRNGQKFTVRRCDGGVRVWRVA